MQPHFIADGGEVARLGVAEMRLLLSQEQTEGRISAGEFRGSAGAWTVPHVHQGLDEFFYIVDGNFLFTCDDEEYDAGPRSLLMVPRGSRHVFRAKTDGTVLVLWTPGGLERMFLELGRLPADSITDPAVRAEIGRRHDSTPVFA